MPYRKRHCLHMLFYNGQASIESCCRKNDSKRLFVRLTMCPIRTSAMQNGAISFSQRLAIFRRRRTNGTRLSTRTTRFVCPSKLAKFDALRYRFCFCRVLTESRITLTVFFIAFPSGKRISAELRVYRFPPEESSALAFRQSLKYTERICFATDVNYFGNSKCFIILDRQDERCLPL